VFASILTISNKLFEMLAKMSGLLLAVCRLSVVCLPVTYVLWLNCTFYRKHVQKSKEGCPTSTM